MTEAYPLDDAWSEADDERWLKASSPPDTLTPEEDFDAFFELWQDGAEDTHVRESLEALDAQGRRLMAKNAARDVGGAVNAGPRLQKGQRHVEATQESR